MGCHQTDAAEQAAGHTRVNDRRVPNGIFWVLRSGAQWPDLPDSFGPYTTCYNRFVRWPRAGVWDQVLDAYGDRRGRDTGASWKPVLDQSILIIFMHPKRAFWGKS